MKKLLIPLLLVVCPVLANNPIIDAVKEEAWPVYQCVLNVEGNNVTTTTNDTEYSTYQLRSTDHVYTSEISGSSVLILYVERQSDNVMGVIYKGNDIISTYKGTCLK